MTAFEVTTSRSIPVEEKASSSSSNKRRYEEIPEPVVDEFDDEVEIVFSPSKKNKTVIDLSQ